MGKKTDKQESGYYEIRRGTLDKSTLPVSIITGNVIYNALHWHDHVEVIYCVAGRFRVRVEEQIFTMGAGDILLVNGRDSHEIFDGTRDGLQVIASISAESLRNPSMRYICQTVGDGAMEKTGERAARLRKLLGRLAYYMTPALPEGVHEKAQGKPVYDMTPSLSEKIHEKVQGKQAYHMDPALAKDVYEKMLVSDNDWYGYLACCYQLLQVLSDFQDGEKKENERDKNEDFRRCISYIHDHYQEELGIGKLAKVMNVSEPGLYRIFQNKLAVTPTTYIHIIRIRMACALLKNPERRVADVAFECGFSSLSNFYRTFEKQMGISPREYRKKMADASDVSLIGFFVDASYQNIQSVMDANVFQNFFELPYDRDVFLACRTVDVRQDDCACAGSDRESQ